MIWQSEKETSSSPWSRGIRVLAALVAAGVASFAALVPASSATTPVDDYIVLLRADADAPELAREERRRGNEVEDVFDSRVNGLVAKLDRADVKRLRQDPDVAVVERDRPVWALAVRDSATTLWGLDRIDQRTRPGNGRITTATDGSGVTAYVIDTGIRSDHEQFEDRVAARGFSAFSDQYGWEDCQGHGTHVAGTVAGKDYGVAPKAELVAIRVLGCTGSGSTSGVIAGMDWVAADHPAGAPAVANLSLGGGFSSSMNLAIRRLFNDGVSVAVAAGNSNADACNASPASAPEAITVGATTSTDDRAWFSNFGRCLDVFAPGAGILSATQVSTTSTATWNGTSMASPHVAGVAALLLSAEPGLSPAAVTDSITGLATVGAVGGIGARSPDRLLFTGEAVIPKPSVEGPDSNGRITFTGSSSGQTYLCSVGPDISGPLRECGNPYSLPPSLTNGTYAFRVAIADPSGLRSDETSGTFTIADAPRPPVGQIGVRINNGAEFTADPEVTLDLVWPAGTRKVLASNTGFGEVKDLPVAASVPWTLANSGSERVPRSVNLKFIGPAGVELDTATAEILLDRTPPAVAASRLLGKKRPFRVRLAATDRGSGLDRVQFSTRKKRPVADVRAGAVRSMTRSTATVRSRAVPRWYRAVDRAGNWSGWAPIRRPSR